MVDGKFETTEDINKKNTKIKRKNKIKTLSKYW